MFEFFPQPDLALPSLPQGLERRGLILDLPVFPLQRPPLPPYDLPESLGLLLVVLGIRYRPPREATLHVQEGLCVSPDAESSIDSEHWQTSPFLYNAAILQFGHKATGIRAYCQRLHYSVPAPERVVRPSRLAKRRRPERSSQFHDLTEVLIRRWPARIHGTRGRRTRANRSRILLTGRTSARAKYSQSPPRPPHPPSRTGNLPTGRDDRSGRSGPSQPVLSVAARTWTGVQPLQTAGCPPCTRGQSARTRPLPCSLGASDP